MEVSESKLEPPDEFPFPFNPYSIQKDLMRSLYETLEEKKFGIFESPTGTGKSMSLICGSLKWLLDAQQRLKDDIVLDIKKLDQQLKNTSLGANWLDEHAAQAKSKHKRDSLQSFMNKITAMESRVEQIKEKAKKVTKLKLKPSSENNNGNKHEDDDDILLDDFADSDSVDEKSSDSEVEAEDKENYHGIKVFLCSRTHSQLSQLVREVQKSPYSDLKIRVVSLASRQNYCVNESVLNLKYLPLINDKCQELHDKKKGKTTKTALHGQSVKRQKTTSGCPFHQQGNTEDIKVKILTEIVDIEQLVHWGKEFGGCPYYASRQSVDEAQLILVPYNTILHRSTRLACGINLKNSVVIIDEAHNLLDTIGNIHSCVITGLQLAQGLNQLTQYKERYSEKFSAINLLHLNQLIFIVSKLVKKVGAPGGNATQTKQDVTIETLAEFILSCEIDTINLYKVLEFVAKSRVVNKLQGFLHRYGPAVAVCKKEADKGVSAFLKSLTAKKETKDAQETLLTIQNLIKRTIVLENDSMEGKENMSGNPIMHIVNFIQSLTNHCLDGRIVCTRSQTTSCSSLKYLLLNPASHFSDIVKEARSVVLAGGTMQPVSEFTEQLFYLAGGTPDRVKVFSCGHIIPESNILPLILGKGPSGKSLDFSYQLRNSTDVLDELGRLLINVCNVVPAGVVCFFPSYDYEDLVYRRFQDTGVIDKLLNKKKVFREPKKSNKVEQVLVEYGRAAKSKGALLFSVVGGKLSEGLNFSDDLGRCVMVVGLPYPNLTSVELKEKMKYLDEEVGPTAGKTYYENVCMKAVNQSIGRAIRHKDDYASVLLIDRRYFRQKCVEALPEWIQGSLRKEENFGPAISLLARFFAARKPK